MKILYLSSWHPVLEWDDLQVFETLGLDWFSTGIYLNPQVPHPTNMRGSFNKEVNNDYYDLWVKYNKTYNIPRSSFNVPKDLVKDFDIIFISNFIQYLYSWDSFKDKVVIFRSYDRHIPQSEMLLKKLQSQGLKIVRLFDFETRIPYSCPSDCVINYFVDTNVYKKWEGSEKIALTFNNDFFDRINITLPPNTPLFPSYREYLKIREQIPCQLYGANNKVNFCGGLLSWKEQIDKFSKHRCYLSLGSKPAPYTYSFLESLAAGCPTVSFGKLISDDPRPEYRNSYIVQDLIENYTNGFVSDNTEEIIEFIKELNNNNTLANKISENGKKIIEENFSKQLCVNNWKKFLHI